MIRALGNQSLKLSFPHDDAESGTITCRITDASGVEVATGVPVSVAYGAYLVETPSVANQLGTLRRDIRVVEIEITNVDGVKSVRSFEYLIESADVLAEGENSFQTYPSAILASLSVSSLSAWNESSKDDRITALIDARLCFGPLRFRYAFDDNKSVDLQSESLGNITTITPSQWHALPADFKAAVCRAQVMQADYLLSRDTRTDARAAGLLSQTIGESSETYAKGKPIAASSVLCQRAMRELSRFLSSANRKTTRVA